MGDLKKTSLTFREAFAFLKDGRCIKRAEWLGYWVIEKGPATSGQEDIVMYCKDGKIVHMLSGCSPVFILENTLADDWMVVDEKHRQELDLIRISGLLNPAAANGGAAQ